MGSDFHETILHEKTPIERTYLIFDYTGLLIVVITYSFLEMPTSHRGNFFSYLLSGDSKITMGIIIGVVGVAVIVFCTICIVKKRRPTNSANTDANVPMTASHDTQPPPSPPGYPYPPYSPPPYPDPEGGGEGTPQYPPPGESYPWLQKNVPAHPSV